MCVYMCVCRLVDAVFVYVSVKMLCMDDVCG